MKKAFLLFFYSCLATALYGQNIPNTLLWKVTKSGSVNESFLFGTFHEVNPLFFDSLTNVLVKLRQSDLLFVEQRSFAPINAGSIKQLPWSSKKWDMILTNEQKQTFTAFVKKAEDSSYYNLNPLTLTLAASRLYLTYFCQGPSTLDQLMDSHIENIALNIGKQVFELDSNQQIMLRDAAQTFSLKKDSLYASIAIHSMKLMLDNDDSECQLVNDYRNFRLDYQLEISRNSDDAWLLEDRNTKWIAKLNHVFPKQNCFVAIGFRHLFYKQGLIQKLRTLGYVVTPVPMERLNVKP